MARSVVKNPESHITAGPLPTVVKISSRASDKCASLEMKQRVYLAHFGVFQDRLGRRHAPDVRGLPGAASFFMSKILL